MKKFNTKLREYKDYLARRENVQVDDELGGFMNALAEQTIDNAEYVETVVDRDIDMYIKNIDSIETDVNVKEDETKILNSLDTLFNSNIDIESLEEELKRIIGVYILTTSRYKLYNEYDSEAINLQIEDLEKKYGNKIDSILKEIRLEFQPITEELKENEFTYPEENDNVMGSDGRGLEGDGTLIGSDGRPMEPTAESYLAARGFKVRGENVVDDLVNGSISSAMIKIIEAAIAIPVTTSFMFKNTKNKPFRDTVLKFPMIVSDNIVESTANKLAKAVEAKTALETKAVLEATIARIDGGSITSRLKSVDKLFNPSSKEIKNSTALFGQPMDYDQILGIFSESKYLTPTDNGVVLLAEAMSHTFYRTGMMELLHDSPEPYQVYGENNGVFIQTGRDALPTFIEIKIDYTAFKDPLKLEMDTKSKYITLGIQVTPRQVSSFDIIQTLSEMKTDLFSRVIQTKEEKGFVKKLKNMFRFFKSKGTTEEKKALKSNAFSNIVNKIEKIRTPLFHLVISMDEYRELRDVDKLDIMHAGTYAKLLEKLPLISLSIIDLDTDTIYISEAQKMNYVKYNLDDFVSSMSQYEKELKTFVKLQQYS